MYLEMTMNLTPQKLSAFTSGTVIPIEAVPDPVFAGRLLGDGIAIDPTDGVLVAPCSAKVLQLHAARHACVLQMDNGARLLLHIGIDTVMLKGEGFTARVAQGDVVRAGQPLIEFDKTVLKRHNKPVISMLVIENSDEFRILQRNGNGTIVAGGELLTLVANEAKNNSPTTTAETPDDEETAHGWAVIRHGGGMHARPCALLATAIRGFAASVEIRAHGKSANARSATAVMGLAINEGDEVEIHATGVKAGDALEAAIIAMISGRKSGSRLNTLATTCTSCR